MKIFLRLLALIWLFLFGILSFGALTPNIQGLNLLLLPLYLLMIIACLALLFLSKRGRKILGMGLILLFVINLAGSLSLLKGRPIFPVGDLALSALNWFAALIGAHFAIPLFFPEILMGLSAAILFLPASKSITLKKLM